MGFKSKAGLSLLGLVCFFVLGGWALAGPSTTNYWLQSYGFGSGGTGNSSTANYSLTGITGELSGQTAATSTYQTLPGYIQSQQANVPKVTLSNPSNYYDKLLFVLDSQSNPTDVLYALQVCVGADWSGGSCGTTTLYVKSDDTLGSTLTTADYQTYSSWGAGSGTTIIGLNANTTYYIRAKATQGKFTESAYGPSSSAATVGQQISFCLYTNANCAGGGHSESLSILTGSVATSGNIGVDFSTNADSGGSVYIYSTGALTSTLRSGTPISSSAVGTTSDLSSASKGYGAQVVSPASLTKKPPFDQSANVVGSLSTTIQTILSASAPVTSTASQIQLQARSDNTIKAAPDYADTVTLIAAALF